MTKLDWNRTRQDRDGYDAALAREWRSGPSGGSFARPDGAEALNLLATPTIYWGREMTRAYPPSEESLDSHVRLFAAARRAAAHIYFSSGWPTARSRVREVHRKASPYQDRHYPTAHYAVYFDYWVMTFARGDALNRTGVIPGHVFRFSDRDERVMRAPMHIGIPTGEGARVPLNRVTELDQWIDRLYDAMKQAELE